MPPDSAEGEVSTKLLEAIKNKESLDNLRTILASLNEVGGAHQSKPHPFHAVLVLLLLTVQICMRHVWKY